MDGRLLGNIIGCQRTMEKEYGYISHNHAKSRRKSIFSPVRLAPARSVGNPFRSGGTQGEARPRSAERDAGPSAPGYGLGPIGYLAGWLALTPFATRTAPVCNAHDQRRSEGHRETTRLTLRRHRSRRTARCRHERQRAWGQTPIDRGGTCDQTCNRKLCNWFPNVDDPGC